MTTITLGSPVPDFQASATDGKTVCLSDFSGQWLVLYFYPKDNTPGCTQQGQDFRDHFTRFAEANAVVVGVSRDSVRVHEGFKAKQQLPFDLLSDTDETLCRLFDVIAMKNLYGKQVRGIVRSTFLIDPHGVLAYAWRKVKVKGHALEVLAKLSELAGVPS